MRRESRSTMTFTQLLYLAYGVLIACFLAAVPASAAERASKDWKPALRAELAKCENLNFFKRQACVEKARWKYCSKPGHSDQAPEECGSTPPEGSGGNRPTPPWVHALRADLAECEKQSFFKSQTCMEKARWKHCNTRWEQAPECGSKPKSDSSGVM